MTIGCLVDALYLLGSCLLFFSLLQDFLGGGCSCTVLADIGIGEGGATCAKVKVVVGKAVIVFGLSTKRLLFLVFQLVVEAHFFLLVPRTTNPRILLFPFPELFIIAQCCLISAVVLNLLNGVGVGHQTTYFLWRFCKVNNYKNVEGFHPFCDIVDGIFFILFDKISCPSFSIDRSLLLLGSFSCGTEEANVTY